MRSVAGKCVSNFLCVACNSTTGSEWDNELIRQLRPLCTMLNVKRAHGRNRPFVVETVSDRRLTLNPDGSMGIAEPLFEAQELAGKTTVKMHARTMREMKRMLSGLKKKHPQIDVDELMNQAEPVQEYSGEPYAIPLSVGGALAGRSMVKSCLAMVYDAGLTTDQCEEAKHYLLKGDKPCFGFFTKRDLVRKPPGEDLLSLHPCSGRSTAATDSGLRGVFRVPEVRRMAVQELRRMRILALLHSQSGDGKRNWTSTLCSTSTQPIWRKSMTAETWSMARLRGALGVLVGAWKEMDVDRARTRAIDDAIAFACAECGISEGDILSDEQAAQFTRVVSDRMTPYLLHTIVASRLTEDDRRAIQKRLRGAHTKPGTRQVDG